MELRCEIVRILNGASLLDCESYQRQYRTRDGNALAPGHYIVLWDESVQSPEFDENATYVGPYKSSSVASLTLTELLRSGATAAGAGIQERFERVAA